MKQLAALCLATSLCVPAVFATTDTFTTVQTNEINRIVGQYLQDNPKVVMQSIQFAISESISSLELVSRVR